MYGYGQRSWSLGFGRPWTPAVRAIIIACGAAWLLQLLLGGTGIPRLLALDTAHPLQLWRPLTYLFLHGGLFHLLFNMFAVWMFGSELEARLGTRRFLVYYFATGIGAGLTVTLIDLLLGRTSLVIGASGAVFGLLLAYGVLYAERVITLLVFFVLPVSMKAKHFVIVFGVLELLFGIAGETGIAHFAHLGGMAVGWLILPWVQRLSPSSPAGAPVPRALRAHWEAWRRARDQRRMDALLEKVNTRGIQSLSAAERDFLHRMSRRSRWN